MGQNFRNLFEAPPRNLGRTIFVAPGDSYTVNGQSFAASDDNDGFDVQRALRTLNRAAAIASEGDTILLLPGTHTPTSTVTISAEHVLLTGLPSGNRMRNRAIIAAATGGGGTVIVDGDGIEVSHLDFIATTAETALQLGNSGAALVGASVHDCYFDLETPAANTGTIGIDCGLAAQHVTIQRCTFVSDGAQGPGIVTTFVDSSIIDCDFRNSAGTWAAGLSVGVATDRTLIERCRFLCSGTAMTVGIDGTSATLANGAFITDCRFSALVTTPVDGFDTSEAELSENYHMGVGAMDGGALVTAIT